MIYNFYMKINFLIYCIITFSLLQSCEKKCQDKKPILLEQEMKDWIFFQIGSYWIYEDSISKSIDSVYITDAKIERIEYFNPRQKCPKRIADVININFSSILGEKIEINGVYGAGSGVQNDTTNIRGNALIKNLNHSGGDGGHSFYMFFPVVQGTIGAWNGFTFIKHDTIYPTYNVKGKMFNNVLRIHDTGNGAYNSETKFYHVKHIGVIRKEIYEMDLGNPTPKLLQVWELTNYKVKQ
jgi:hypothetical protein